jgi:DNA-binding NarL/FixJ family response regulator
VYADLPAREKAIITLMVQGKSGSAMARKLKVTVSHPDRQASPG